MMFSKVPVVLEAGVIVAMLTVLTVGTVNVV